MGLKAVFMSVFMAEIPIPAPPLHYDERKRAGGPRRPERRQATSAGLPTTGWITGSWIPLNTLTPEK
jgi:hypothetical protein